MLRFLLFFLLFAPQTWASESAQEELVSIEIITGNAQPDQLLPLVIALHGMGDRADNYARIFQHMKTPSRVVLIQAPDTWRRGYSWFGGKRPKKPAKVHNAQIVSSADRVAKLTRKIMKTRPTLGKPIVTGFSQGGMLSFLLPLRYPDLYGLSIPIAGVLPRAFLPKKKKSYPTKVIGLHGDRDKIMPLSRTQQRIKRLKRIGVDVEIEVFENVRHRVTWKIQKRMHELITEFVEAR